MGRVLRVSAAVALVLGVIASRGVASVLQVTNLPTGKFVSSPSISGDGRLVVLSSSGNLGGLNPTPIGNGFIYDMLTGQFTRFTAEGASDPVISADGRYIAFGSSADYARRNEDGSDEIFRYDRVRRRFNQLTRDKLGDGSSYLPSISGDGKRVAFETSSNLRSRNPDFSNEVYFYNRSGNMALSVDPEGEGESHQPAVSGDGKMIAFVTNSNLTGRNLDFSQELMIYDLAARDLSQVTNDPEGNGESSQPAASGDGRFVVFVSSSNLGPGDNPDNASAVWIRRKSGGSTLVTTTPLGPFDADAPSINHDGKWIAFTSFNNITGANANGGSEIFVYNRERKTFLQLTDGPSNCTNLTPRLSGNGARLAYLSNCNPLGTNADKTFEAFVIDNPALNLVVHAEGPVNLVLTDPENHAVSNTTNTISNATYESGDFDGDLVPEVRITIPQAVEGRYRVQVTSAGAVASDPVTIDGTLNDTTVPLAADTFGALVGTEIGFGNQSYSRISSRLTPLNGVGSKLYLGGRVGHSRAATGPLVVRFNDGTHEQVLDFGPVENLNNGNSFRGTVDGFAVQLRVINRRDNSMSISLSAKEGDLTEFAGDDNLNMTVTLRVGNDTDMYNWRFKRNLLTQQLILR